MDSFNNEKSPRRQIPQNFGSNLSDPPPYYPQNAQNPQIPPPHYSQNYSHHSPIFHHYPPPPGYAAPYGYQHQQFPQPRPYFPTNNSPTVGSPVERRLSDSRHSSGHDSTNNPVEIVEGHIEEGVQRPTEIDETVNRRQWSSKEDEALISCFLQFSVDSTVGTNQSMPILWGKIFRAYKMIQQSNNMTMHPRNQESLRGRWRRLSSGISQWVGCYEQANRRRRSGMSEDDIISEALTIYASDYSKSKFAFMQQWLKLKDQPRWETFLPQLTQKTSGPDSVESNSSGKRIHLGDDDLNFNFDNLSTAGHEDESVPETAPAAASQPSGGSSRPPGRQASKRNKGKKKVTEEEVEEIERVKEYEKFSKIVKDKKKIVKDKKEIAYLQTFNNFLTLNRELTDAEKIAYKMIYKKLGFKE